ncbi:hypothetical protein QQ045_028796 [Rhodiola kirilowii]
MDTSHGNGTTGMHPPATFDLDDRSPSGNKLVSLASQSSSSSSTSLDEHINPYIDEANDANPIRTSTSVNAAPNHFNPFIDDAIVPASVPALSNVSPDHDRYGSDLPTSTFPTTPSSSYIPDSVPKIDVRATLSPASQIMEIPGDDASPYQIPDYAFQRNKSRAPKEWSTASNESLFSIQMGHMSFAGDLSLYKSGELGMNNKSGELLMHQKSKGLTEQKSNKSEEFGSYSSSGELGYGKSVDLGWYTISGELATHRQTTPGSVQMNFSGDPWHQSNVSNSAGTKNPFFSHGFHGSELPNLGPGVGATDAVAAEMMKDVLRENEQNHNLIGSPSLAIGFSSPSTAGYLDEHTSSTKSFTFPVLTKQDKSPSSLTQSSIRSNNQQHPSQQAQTPQATINPSSSTNTQTQSSFFCCFSCCPLRI